MKYILFFQIETTEDKDDLIVVDKKKMCLLDCPPGEMCFPTQPPMCGPPLENAETPKEGKDKISILPLFKRYKYERFLIILMIYNPRKFDIFQNPKCHQEPIAQEVVQLVPFVA